MPIEEELRVRQIAAMKAKDTKTSNVIKMIKSKVIEKRTSKGFAGDIDDALYVSVIAAYKKSLEKARVEFAKAGDKAEDSIAELDHDIMFCQQFLPQPIGEDEVRTAVKKAIFDLGESVTPAMGGRVVGAVMKAHKGTVDAAIVKMIVDQELSA